MLEKVQQIIYHFSFHFCRMHFRAMIWMAKQIFVLTGPVGILKWHFRRRKCGLQGRLKKKKKESVYISSTWNELKSLCPEKLILDFPHSYTRKTEKHYSHSGLQISVIWSRIWGKITSRIYFSCNSVFLTKLKFPMTSFSAYGHCR